VCSSDLRPSSFEYKIIDKNGNEKWISQRNSYIVDDKEKLTAIQGIVSDITERKQSEEALKLSEEKFRSIVETTAEWIWELNAERRYIYSNNRVESILGYTADEILNMDAYSLVEAEDLIMLHDKFPDWISLKQGWKNVVVRCYHKNGTLVYLESNATPKIDSNGNLIGFLGVDRDITERKLAEEALEAETERRRGLFEQSPDGNIVLDPTTARFKEFNETAHKQLGYSREEFAKLSIFDIEAKETPEEIKAVIARVINNEKDDFETLHRTKQGEIRNVHVKAQIINIQGQPVFSCIWRDITEHKQAEEALRKSEEQLKLALEGSNAGLWVWKIPTGELMVNDRWAEICGYSKDELEPINVNTWEQLTHPDDLTKSWNELQKHFSGASLAYECEIRMKHKDGHWVWILDRGKATEWDKDGKPVRMAGTHIDISERKQMEVALEKRIVALTQPLGDSRNITFEELFNIDEIQKIQDLFAQATNVASIITHTDGTPITQPSNFCNLCKDIIRNTEEGRKNCYYSDAVIGRYNPGGPIVQPCLSGGLWDAGASITVGGRHIANWLIGQVRDETQNEETMLQYASKIGADENEFLEAFRKVKTMSREQFNHIAEALYSIAEQLSTSAYQNMQQARFITERKQAEETILENEEKFRAAFENAPTGMSMILPDGKYIDVNPMHCKMLGYTKEELLAGTINKITHPDDIERGNAWIRKMISGDRSEPEFEKRYIHKDGHIVWGLVKAEWIKDKSGKAKMSIVHIVDITERKKTEEALRESQERLQTFMDSATDAFTIWDKDLRLIDLNKAALSYLPGNTSKENILGKNLLDFLPYLKDSGHVEQYEDIIATGIPINREDHVSLPPVEMWVNTRAFKVGEGLGIVTTDITERKKAETELLEKEAKLRSIFLAAPVAIGLAVDRNFQECNDTFFNMTGYTQKEIIGKNARLIYPTEEEYQFVGREQIRQINEQSAEVIETRWLRKDGLIINVLLRFVALDISDFSKGVTFTALEITERKLAEQALKESEEKYRSIVEYALTGIFTIDEDYHFIYANDEFCRIFGYSKKELIGMDFRNILAPGSLQTVADRYKRRQAGEDVPARYELNIIRGDGEVRSMDMSVRSEERRVGKECRSRWSPYH